jgi:hypothetical protein
MQLNTQNQSLSSTMEDRLDKQLSDGNCDMWEITDPEKNKIDPVTWKLIEKLKPGSNYIRVLMLKMKKYTSTHTPLT